jgi:putative sterol carrier protein
MSDAQQLDPNQVQQLAEAVRSLGDDELLQVLASQPGGYKATLDQAFDGMAAAYNPAKANREAVFQWDVATPEGVETYTVRCGDACTVEHAKAEAPTVTLGLPLPDFLRLILGELDGMQAFMTGKLKLAGDIMLAQATQSWFDRPGG